MISLNLHNQKAFPMTIKDLIKSEITKTHKRTVNLIDGFKPSEWLQTPKTLHSNVNWQIGHIIVANYLHGIASFTGPNADVREKLDIKSYVKFYGLKSDPTNYFEYKPNTATLKEQLDFIYQLVLETIEHTDFKKVNEPTKVKNPGAKTQMEAILWLIQHQSWHNGQLAILKRVLSNPV